MEYAAVSARGKYTSGATDTMEGFTELCAFLDAFIMYIYNILSTCMPAGQKRAPDLIADVDKPLYGYWELNSGPLEEQLVLMTPEPSS